MTFFAERKLKSCGYIYRTDGEKFYARANYTFGILSRKAELCDKDGKAVCTLKQRSTALKLVSLPFRVIVPDYSMNKYYFYKNGELCGSTAGKPFSSGLVLDTRDGVYRFRTHSDNYISVMKDESQAALIKKESVSVNEANRYKVIFDDKAVHKEFALFLTAFADVCYNPVKVSDLASVRYGKTVGKEKYPEMIEWKPEENNADQQEKSI